MSKAKKKLRVKEVAAVAQSITNAQETLPTEVISALKSCRHLDLFVDRKQLVELLEQKSTIFEELVASISSDYTTLYKSLKGRQYADFQLKWLDHVRQVAEYGFSLAAMDAQVDDCDDFCLPNSASFAKWASVCIEYTSKYSESLDTEINYIMLHWIAKEVFNSMQTQVYECKQDTAASSSTEGTPIHEATHTSDDGLFRMCGAELARMIKVKSDQIRKLKHGTACHDIDMLKKEVAFLKSLCIRNEEKYQMQESIPTGVQNLDKGYLWVPLPALKPFLVGVDQAFRKHVNNREFKKHGSHLFEVAEPKFLDERKNMIPLFCSCLGCSSSLSPEAMSVYESLFTKMINLRKEDWKNTNERVELNKGTRSNVTLMLRDELKPHAAKRRQQ